MAHMDQQALQVSTDTLPKKKKVLGPTSVAIGPRTNVRGPTATDVTPRTFSYKVARDEARWRVAVLSAIDKGNWRPVRWCLKNKLLNDDSLQWGFQELARHASEVTLKAVLQLQQLRDIQLGPVLTETVTRGLWSVVKLVLLRGISDSMRAWAVGEAIQHAGNEDLQSFLHVCTGQERDCLLTEAVTRGLWDCVYDVLRLGASDARRQWAVVEASKRAGDHALSKLLRLGDITTEDNCLLLNEAVFRGLWQSVVQLLSNGAPQREREWALCEASKRAPEAVLEDVFKKCLYRCERLLDEVLINLVSRDFWNLVITLMPHRVTRLQTKFILVQARKHASCYCYQAILKTSHTPPSTDLAVTRAVKYGLWHVLVHLLHLPQSEGVRKWAIEEALKSANEKTRLSIITLKTLLHSASESEGPRAHNGGCARVHCGRRGPEDVSLLVSGPQASNLPMTLTATCEAVPRLPPRHCTCRSATSAGAGQGCMQVRESKVEKRKRKTPCPYHTLQIAEACPLSPNSRLVILSVGRSVVNFCSKR